MHGEIGLVTLKHGSVNELIRKDEVIIVHNVCTEKYTFNTDGMDRYVDEDRLNVRTGKLYNPSTADFKHDFFC